MEKSKGHKQSESSKWPELELFEQQNKVVLDYNPKNKINIHRSYISWINDWINK